MSDTPIHPAKYLPEEIQIQILSRCPVKSLLQFRCVCKSWLSLISDPDFIQLHLTRSSDPSLDREHILVAPHYISKPEDDHRIGLHYVGTCNGLICFSMHKQELVVFNPSTKNYKELPLPPVRKLNKYICFWGFGFDSSSDDYKLVLYLERPFFQSSKFMVLNFKDGFWRITQEDNDLGLCSRSAVFVNGCLHWITEKMDILCFDLSNEVFKEIRVQACGLGCYDIGVVRGSLWISRYTMEGFPGPKYLWEMKEYTNVKSSWFKRFTLSSDVPGNSITPMFFVRNGEILVGSTERDFVAYNPSKNSRRVIEAGTEINFKELFLVPFTESLVSPNCGKDWRGRQQFMDFMAERVGILDVGSLDLPN